MKEILIFEDSYRDAEETHRMLVAAYPGKITRHNYRNREIHLINGDQINFYRADPKTIDGLYADVIICNCVIDGRVHSMIHNIRLRGGERWSMKELEDYIRLEEKK